jgi:hypothetical protein
MWKEQKPNPLLPFEYYETERQKMLGTCGEMMKGRGPILETRT